MRPPNKYPAYKEHPLYGMYRLKEYLSKVLIGRTVTKVKHTGGYDSPHIETLTLDNGYEFSLESINGCECCGGINSSLRFRDENLEGIIIRSIRAEHEDEDDEDNGCFTITFTGNRRRKVLCIGDEGKDGFGGWGYGWYVTAGFPNAIKDG
jgi:hypothetical protein